MVFYEVMLNKTKLRLGPTYPFKFFLPVNFFKKIWGHFELRLNSPGLAQGAESAAIVNSSTTHPLKIFLGGGNVLLLLQWRAKHLRTNFYKRIWATVRNVAVWTHALGSLSKIYPLNFLQVVSGTITYIDIKVVETKCPIGTRNLAGCEVDTSEEPYICEVAVWKRAWLNSTKVIDEKTRYVK